MKTILLRGPMCTQSGYGVHTRQIARWLFRHAKGVDPSKVTTEPTPWGSCHMLLNPEFEDGLVGQMIQASSATNKKSFYDATIQVQLPNEWNPFLGGWNVGVTAGVEATTCNPNWVDAVNRMDLVVVPSTFTRESFLNTGECKTPIVVVPEAFPDCFLGAQRTTVTTADDSVTTGLRTIVKTDKNFLVVGQLTGNDVDNDRKNLPYTLKWFLEAFDGNPNVGLILKTSGASNTELDKRNTLAVFLKMVAEIRGNAAVDGKKLQQGPQVYLLHGRMTDEEMRDLYCSPLVSAFLSLTHGEGYGLPILEAAACGLPIVATNWSGHLEFLRHGKFSAVETSLVNIPKTRQDPNIFMSDTKWGQPDEQDAKRRMKKFVEQPKLPMEWATKLQQQVQEKYNFKEVATQLDKTLLDKLV